MAKLRIKPKTLLKLATLKSEGSIRIAVGFEALTGLLLGFKSALGSAAYCQIEWQFSGDRVAAMGISHWGGCRTAAF